MTAATQKWLSFAQTFEKGYKFTTNEVEKIYRQRVQPPKKNLHDYLHSPFSGINVVLCFIKEQLTHKSGSEKRGVGHRFTGLLAYLIGLPMGDTF